jgi:hypothetical protein
MMVDYGWWWSIVECRYSVMVDYCEWVVGDGQECGGAFMVYIRF